MTLLECDPKKIGNNDQINQQNERQGNDWEEEFTLRDLSPVKEDLFLVMISLLQSTA